MHTTCYAHDTQKVGMPTISQIRPTSFHRIHRQTRYVGVSRFTQLPDHAKHYRMPTIATVQGNRQHSITNLAKGTGLMIV